MTDLDLLLQDKILSRQLNVFRFTASERKRILEIFLAMQKDLKAKLAIEDVKSKTRVIKLLQECNKVIESYYKQIASTNFVELAKDEVAFVNNTFIEIGLEPKLPNGALLKSLAEKSFIGNYCWSSANPLLFFKEREKLLIGGELTIETLIKGLVTSPIKDYWEKLSVDTQAQFAMNIRQGVAQGETLQQIITRIVGSKKLGTPGVMEISRRHASSFVHTSVQTVVNDARLINFKANADILKGYRHLSTLDSHTSPVCIARSGMEWDLNGKPTTGHFPFQNPPLHFNCRSVLVPVTKSYRDLGLDIDEPPKGTRASDLGQIPADTSFDAFLKRHDAQYVDELLGPGRADLWRKGKITLSQLVDGTGRELTLKELRKAA